MQEYKWQLQVWRAGALTSSKCELGDVIPASLIWLLKRKKVPEEI